MYHIGKVRFAMAVSLQFQYDHLIEDLGVTTVENSFISLYMPQMPGEYVKVYLFGLKACRYGKPEILSNAVIAETLSLSERDVEAAWQYFKKIGIVEMVDDRAGHTRVSYQQIAAKVLNGTLDTQTPDSASVPDVSERPEGESEERVAAMYAKLQLMIGSKPMSKTAMFTFRRFVTEYGFDPETVCVLVEHGLNMIDNKDQTFTDNQTLKYLEAIARNWWDKGVVTHQDAEAEIKNHQERAKAYRDILCYLGIKRNPIQWEMEMIDVWMDEYGFDMSVIEEALSRTNSSSIKYVNGILSRWHDSGYTSAGDVKKEPKPRKSNTKATPPEKEDQWLSEQFDAMEAESVAEMIERSKGD